MSAPPRWKPSKTKTHRRALVHWHGRCKLEAPIAVAQRPEQSQSTYRLVHPVGHGLQYARNSFPVSSEQLQVKAKFPCRLGRGLTPRSRRGPTALHLAREAPWFIMRLAGQVQHRRSRLNSNVRHRLEATLSRLNTARPSGLASSDCGAFHTPISAATRASSPLQSSRSVRTAAALWAGSFCGARNRR